MIIICVFLFLLVKSAYELSMDVKRIQKDIMTYGPVTFRLKVFDDFFHYKSGMLTSHLFLVQGKYFRIDLNTFIGTFLVEERALHIHIYISRSNFLKFGINKSHWFFNKCTKKYTDQSEKSYLSHRLRKYETSPSRPEKFHHVK